MNGSTSNATAQFNDVECNFHEAGEIDWQKTDDEEFLVIALGAAEKQSVYDTVPYCSLWRNRSGLYLAKSELIQRTYSHRDELGLLGLFLNESFLECVREWTSKELVKREQRSKALRMDELLAYLGRELATSIHRLNHLRDYCSNSDLLGIPFFKQNMGRDKFMNILASLRLYPCYDPDDAVLDPLWHSRQLLEHFARNAATIAIPVGVSSLDENTVRCKGRTGARSYMKSKPVKFGIRFYAVVGWSHAYLHSVQDNGSGNKSGQSPVQRYTYTFRNLGGAVERKVDGTLVGKSTSSALWCAKMAHQTQLHPTPSCGRLMVMDNFYTRHVLARQLLCLSDGECRVLGTVRFTNIDGMNRPALKEAIESLKHANRGFWRLVQVLQREGSANMPVSVAEKTGFVVFKDRAVMSFYSNDLADTPRLRIHAPDPHAVTCVHGLAPLQRWVGHESVRRTTLQVPAIIVAYNLFMNAVDRFDQFRSTSATLRKEERVSMSLPTFILDASIINAHALLNAISKKGGTIIDLQVMKQRIIKQLVSDHVTYQQQRASISSPTCREDAACLRVRQGVERRDHHILLETEGKRSVRCLLCKALSRSNPGYTIYSCTECKCGFQVNCFALFHQKKAFRNVRPDIYNAMKSAEVVLSSSLHRNRRNKVTATLKNVRLLYKKYNYCSLNPIYAPHSSGQSRLIPSNAHRGI